MSSYRDDSQDTAVASDKTFGGLRAVVDEVLRVSDALLFGLLVTVSSSAIASDQVIDISTQTLNDSALVTDHILGVNNTRYTHTDTAKVNDALSYGLSEVLQEQALAKDTLLNGSLSSTAIDSAKISDSMTSQRTVSSLVHDIAAASDGVTAIERDTVIDSISATDSITDGLRAIQVIDDTALVVDAHVGATSSAAADSALITDTLIAQRVVSSFISDASSISDEVLSGYADVWSDVAHANDWQAGTLFAVDAIKESAVIGDAIIDSISQSTTVDDAALISEVVLSKTNSTSLISDIAVIEDELLSIGGTQGQAWTANVDSWAMSRYNPYNFNRLVVIDGMLYGEADDGVYRLDQAATAVTARIKTGKMDLGRGAITHPASAYLEYELAGSASMTVHTTQKGTEQQYTYVLPNETAEALTNGRFIFGRGLRGRHFAFELTMVGTHGHINDLTIEHMPTSRRV